ncbi:glycosyltransferase [Geobacter sp.]|uniref:glycosyltransferase n=1 Tax=Geobacter sp. TaxID=46610 RepID=UPI002635F0D1|nr:glycosyltransferase [Geobacter sp.]
MKVLKIIHTLGHGGAENTFRWLAWGLRGKGIEVVAAIPELSDPQKENWIAPALDELEVPYLTFDTTGSPWQLLRNIAAVIDRVRPDIVHSHLLDSNFYSALACMSRSVPHICTEHGDVSLKNTAATKVKYGTISLCSRFVVCVSDAVRENASRVVLNRNKLKTIYNGILFFEKNTSSFRGEFNIPDGAVIVGNVGNLYPVKGQKHLIRAFSELLRSCSADVYLVIVGRGGERDNLLGLVRDQGIPKERVLLTGFRNDIQNIMNTFDLYVQPSLSEGHPLAVLEAMSLGIPVIATAVGGVPEIIGEDKFGTLVIPASWEDLDRAMREFFRDREYFCERACAARIYARQTFSIEKMTDSYIGVYQQALAP